MIGFELKREPDPELATGKEVSPFFRLNPPDPEKSEDVGFT